MTNKEDILAIAITIFVVTVIMGTLFIGMTLPH